MSLAGRALTAGQTIPLKGGWQLVPGIDVWRAKVWSYPVALVALCLLLLAPLTMVDVPPLLDYPNHLARAFVLAHITIDPTLTEFYRPHWSILPNLATDVLLTPLLTALPNEVLWVHLAGRVVVGAFLLLPVLGAVFYSRAVFRRSSWWPLGSGLIAYNAAFLQGFLNFTAAIGLALLCAAMWLHWRHRYPVRTIAIASFVTAMLFFCHLMGLGFFLLLIAAAEIEAAWKNSRQSSQIRFPVAIACQGFACLPLLVLPALLYAASEFRQLDAEPQWRSTADKFAHLLDPVINYNFALDALTASTVVGFLLIAAVAARLKIPAISVIVLATLFTLYALAPFDFKGTAALDMRFVILAAFMLFAGLLPTLPEKTAQLAAGLFVALFLVRMAVVSAVWVERGNDLAQIRQTIAPVPPGSRVYLTSTAPTDAPEYWRRRPHGLLSDGTRTDYHLAALLVIEQRSFWPYLFANASQQPVELTPRYAALAEQTIFLSDAAFVAACRSTIVPAALDTVLCGYDFLLLLEPAALPEAARCAPHLLSLVTVTEMAALFRIKAGLCTSPAGGETTQSAVVRLTSQRTADPDLRAHILAELKPAGS